MIQVGVIGCGRIVELGHAPGIKEVSKQVTATENLVVTSYFTIVK